MQSLLAFAIVMVCGLVMTHIMKQFHLPNVTGYLIVGLLIGPCCFNVMSLEMLKNIDVITTVALGFIAFSIGGEFKFANLKQIGSGVVTITMFQAFTAVGLVIIALLAFGFPLPLSLTLGAIAAATAPAATLMVVRQYKAKGPVTNTLLPVVAMDDAVGLMAFAVLLAVSAALSSGQAITMTNTVLAPLLEITLSLVIGFVVGIVMAFAVKIFPSSTNRMIVCVTTVILGVALAEQFNLSSLLLCMGIGATLVNISADADKLLDLCDRWTPPIFMMFFIISGAELDISLVPAVGLLGIVYLVVRSAGKCLGAYVGATVVKAEPNIKKYLGITLLPQAGVAIGMAQLAMVELPEYGAQIKAVVLSATLIYELVGPLLTKMALTKAGEIQQGK